MDLVTHVLWPIALGVATFQAVRACVACRATACLIGGAGGALLWWARFVYSTSDDPAAWLPLTLVALTLMVLSPAVHYGDGGDA